MLRFYLVLKKNSLQKILRTQNVSKLRFFKAAGRRNTVSYFNTDNEEKADFQPFWAGSDCFVSVIGNKNAAAALTVRVMIMIDQPLEILLSIGA